MTPTIYRILFPDGSFYVGATNNFAARRRDHRRAARDGNAPNRKLRAAFARNPSFAFEALASGLDADLLHELEAVLIAQLQPTLNTELVPKPLPACRRRRAGLPPKPFGPHASMRKAAIALGISPRYLRDLCHLGYEVVVERLGARA